MKYSDIEDAYHYVSAGSGFDHRAVVNLETGETYFASDLAGINEIPEDVDESDKYISIPGKYELNLGRQLVFDFVSDYLPDEYDEVRYIFKRKGAYGRYKEFLYRKGILQRWYEYEAVRQERALREWCEDNGIELTDRPAKCTMDRKRVGIVVFDDIEVLDFCGPFEVFSVTRLDEETRREDPSPFEVFLVGQEGHPITTSGGMKVIPDYTFQNCPKLHILVIPGGWGTRREMNNAVMLDWIRHRASEVETLTSVCTGSMLLGFAGLLDGHRATTHFRSLDWMRDSFPNVTVEHEKHVVEDGSLLTSAGISAGIDMALTVVTRYFGAPIARATAKHMEYPYPENNDRRIEL